ncbi:MAG: hypothetical protein HY077_07020 [Elusimicrobia bacterium]|nr:hypothetical protein [Elusimicrobiota bacterium]
MNKPLLSALLCGLIAAPALALDGNDFFQKLKAGGDAVKEQQAGKAKPAKEQAKIDKVLSDMDDGNEVAGAVAQYVKDHGVKLSLDAKLPDYPRVLSIFIVEEVTPLMFADMPDCAEKHYMAVSLGTRTWLELGGDKKTLPVIEPLDGWKDQTLSDQFKLWLDNGSEMALYKIGQAAKTPSVMELIDAEKSPSRKKTLEGVNKRFVDFLLSESEWRRINAFRLK